MSLENTKEGDAVALYDNDLHRRIVGRCTKTRITVGNKQYSRSSGREIGGSRWHSSFIEVWTDEHDARLGEQEASRKLAKARQFLRDYAWREVTQKQADAVIAALEARNEP